MCAEASGSSHPRECTARLGKLGFLGIYTQFFLDVERICYQTQQASLQEKGARLTMELAQSQEALNEAMGKYVFSSIQYLCGVVWG